MHELQEKLAIASKQLALHEDKAKGSGGHSRHGGRRVARGSAGLGPSALSSALAAAEQAALQQQAEVVAAAVAAASEDEAAMNEVSTAAARGLSMSNTLPGFHRTFHRAGSPDAADDRPQTAPPPIAPLASVPAPATLRPPLAAPALKLPPPPVAMPREAPLELTALMERHVIENQKLREQLLFFTSKASNPVQKKLSRSASSLGMPLPPV